MCFVKFIFYLVGIHMFLDFLFASNIPNYQKMAIRLSIAFDTSAESWLNQQIQFDLWQAEQHRSELNVERLSAA